MKARMREFSVREVLNGFVVNVGCQTLVFNTISSLTDALLAYAQDPKKVEADFGFKDEPVPAQAEGSGVVFSTGTAWAPTASPYDLNLSPARIAR